MLRHASQPMMQWPPLQAAVPKKAQPLPKPLRVPAAFVTAAPSQADWRRARQEPVNRAMSFPQPAAVGDFAPLTAVMEAYVPRVASAASTAPPQGGQLPTTAPPQGGQLPASAPPQGGHIPTKAPPQGGPISVKSIPQGYVPAPGSKAVPPVHVPAFVPPPPSVPPRPGHVSLRPPRPPPPMRLTLVAALTDAFTEVRKFGSENVSPTSTATAGWGA